MNANDILHHKLTIPVATGLAAFGVGFVVGRQTISKSLRADIAEVNRQTDALMKSIADVKAAKEAEAAEELPQPELDEDVILDEIEETIEEIAEVEEPSVVVNVFDKVDADGWVWDEELALREESPGLPYVIHHDEFMQNELDYNQETITYYMGDDILADNEDTPVYNYTGMMGELKFGHGSQDPNVVYIRNDALHMEWEVLRHKGCYEIEVLGHTIEKDYEEADLKHSRVGKFRQE